MKKNYNFLGGLISLFLFFTLSAKAQCGSASTVPYFEGFQNITTNNQLPTCWSASAMGTTCGTYTSSNGFASFFSFPAATSYFYSNNIQLYSGITYSASVWYSTNINGGTNWTSFSMELATAQSPLAPVNIASTSPAVAPLFTALSNTFTVSSSGLYYVVIKASSNGGTSSPILSWDDLSITVPCNYPGNSPTVNISANSTTICSGQPYSQITFTASGADTYSWNTGATSAVTSPVASSPNPYLVSGTNTLSGCSSTASIAVTIFPTPSMTIIVSDQSICLGDMAVFYANGASSYNWSSGQTGPSISVSPTTSTSYTVTGTSNAGCQSSEAFILGVIPPPVITHSPSIANLCSGESYTLVAEGAITYTWLAPGGFGSFNNPYVINQPVSGNYTLTGKDGNGCVNVEYFNLSVIICTDIHSDNRFITSRFIYPNPSEGEFIIDLPENSVNLVRVSDLGGRVIFEINENTGKKNILVNIKEFEPGVYFLTLQSENKITTSKILKK